MHSHPRGGVHASRCKCWTSGTHWKHWPPNHVASHTADCLGCFIKNKSCVYELTNTQTTRLHVLNQNTRVRAQAALFCMLKADPPSTILAGCSARRAGAPPRHRLTRAPGGLRSHRARRAAVRALRSRGARTSRCPEVRHRGSAVAGA